MFPICSLSSDRLHTGGFKMIGYVHYGLILIRLALLAISLWGYLLYLRKRIRMELAVGILFAGIGSVMFAAGILHILKETAWLIFAGGLYLSFQEAKGWRGKKSLRMLRGEDNAAFTLIYLVLAAIFFFVLLFRSKFSHYDNFSHWGVAAKLVSQKDMFPNASDTNLTFHSYPLGSAAFIYYFTEIIGAAPEWLQMWAQAVLMAGMLAGLFVFGKGAVSLGTAGAGIAILLCGNTAFVDLLVDTLLPVTAIGAMSFCIHYKKDLQKQLLFVVPYVVFLVAIKNSGALFAALILGYALISIPRTKENLKKWLIAAASPVVATFFWNKHVEQIFEGGTLSKHAMHVDNFRQVVAEKTPEDLVNIIEAFGLYISQNVRPVFYLLLISLFLILVCRFVFRKDCGMLRDTLWFAGVSYVLYMLGLLGMYILTMPLKEALRMAGFERYHQTILIFASGLVLIAVIQEIYDSGDGISMRIKGLALACCILIGITAVLQPNFRHYIRQAHADLDREKYDRLISDYGLEDEATYLILVSEDRADKSYVYYLTQYLLAPRDMALETASTVNTLAGQKFEFVILLDDTESNRAYLDSQFGLTEEVGYIADKSLG